MTDAWSSNSTLDDIASRLRAASRVVILTHVKPDGDAVGSTLAVTRALNLARPNPLRPIAEPWYAGPAPDWFAALAGRTVHRLLTERNRPQDDSREDPDAVLILDTGAWTQLHEVREWLLPRTGIASVIDHHRHGDPDVAARRFIDPTAASAAELAMQLCTRILGCTDASQLPTDIATPLFLGIATDTGWFRHSNVNAAVLRRAASLLDAGVDQPALYEMIEQNDRPARLKLMARALESMELIKHNRVAILSLTQQDFHDTHAAPTDTGGFSELALAIASVQVCVLLTETFVDHTGSGAAHVTKVSFRAKNGPQSMDVNAVARTLGGGGHIRAAGAKVNASLADAKRRVIEALS
jgi:phosphoesterase RecJ-like protein